jgi:UDP-2,4-diacetamido-2,4,6-trideoxy-beta-L-altropyranose hydrolase
VKVAIRADASLRIGTGHVMRCLTLAKSLKENGHQTVFMCRPHQGHLIDYIEQNGFRVVELAAPSVNLDNDLFHADWLGSTQVEDASQCEAFLKDFKPDWLIVDHYAIDQTWHKELRPNYQKLMVIDDLGDRYNESDLLLDQNYGSTLEKYENFVPKSCSILAGSHYALLRSEFAQWREICLKRRENCQKPQKLLITMGGVDPDNYTGKILQQLAQEPLATINEITVVMGATAPHLETIQQQAKDMPIKTQVKTNVNNMAELMANADLAIGAAGATTWERSCLGLPTIQFVIADNQRQIAQALAKDNVVLLTDNVQKLPGLVKMDEKVLNNLSEKCANICDGLGVNRVVEILEQKK